MKKIKVFRNKITKRLGETQFSDDGDVLIRNAKAAKFKDEEIEIIEMTPKQYIKNIIEQNTEDHLASPSCAREMKIREEMRRLAIESLENRGEL